MKKLLTNALFASHLWSGLAGASIISALYIPLIHLAVHGDFAWGWALTFALLAAGCVRCAVKDCREAKRS